MISKLALAIVFSVMLISGSAAAQSRTDTKKETISGVVSDTSKNLIPGVSLRLTNTESQVRFSALTNDSGNYSFEVPAGKYLLEAALKGFQTSTVSNINLDENETQRYNITLHIGSFSGNFILIDK